MSNEDFRQAARERAARPRPSFATDYSLGNVQMYVRPLSRRDGIKLRLEHEDEDEDTGTARVILRYLVDAHGELLLDPLNDDDVALVRDLLNGDDEFYAAVEKAVGQGQQGKASAQSPSS